MSIYSNPTIHHEDITREVLHLTGGHIKLFRKNVVDVLANDAIKNINKNKFDELTQAEYGGIKIEQIEDLQHYLKQVVPDSFSITQTEDGRIHIRVFEITATNRLNYEKIMKYETITQFIEGDFDVWFYVYVVDPTTKGFSLLDCDMAQHRIEKKTRSQWVDFRPIITESGMISELCEIKDEVHHAYSDGQKVVKPRKKGIKDFATTDEWFEYIKKG